MTSHHFNELKKQVAKQDKLLSQLADIVCEQAKRILALERKTPPLDVCGRLIERR